MKNGLLMLTIVALLASCGNRDKSKNKSGETVTKTAILVDDYDNYRDNASTSIESIALDGNILTISISYSGGCKDHEFSLVGSRMISKSLPPQRGIMLYHNNNGDSCRELKEEQLVFDIKAFEYKPKEEIILTLEGWEEKISFTSK